jgi:hypothetical protein
MEIKDIFGKPGEGIHTERIGKFASVDLFLTIIVSILITIFLNKSFIYIFGILFIGGQILHLVFGVETAFIKMLDKPRITDIIVSFIIGIIIGVVCGYHPVITGVITIVFSLGFNILVFNKITKNITKFIMSS